MRTIPVLLAQPAQRLRQHRAAHGPRAASTAHLDSTADQPVQAVWHVHLESMQTDRHRQPVSRAAPDTRLPPGRLPAQPARLDPRLVHRDPSASCAPQENFKRTAGPRFVYYAPKDHFLRMLAETPGVLNVRKASTATHRVLRNAICARRAPFRQETHHHAPCAHLESTQIKFRAIRAFRAALALLHSKKVLLSACLALQALQQSQVQLLVRNVPSPRGPRGRARLSATNVRKASTQHCLARRVCQTACTFVRPVSLASMGSRIPTISYVPAVPRERFRRATIPQFV